MTESGVSHLSMEEVVEWMSLMKVTHPSYLRACPAACVLSGGGRILRLDHGAKSVEECHNWSIQVEQIPEFCSHSWHGSTMQKIGLLLLLKNGMAAFIVGSVAAGLVMCCFSFDLLPGYVRQPYLGQQGVTYKYGPWSLFAGLLASFCTLFLWSPRGMMFLDRICINQVDQEAKTEGIFNMGAILKNSDSMLVLWDTSYQGRLWCMFELAAFLKSHDQEPRKMQLVIKPTFLAPCTLLIALFLTLMMLFELLVPYVNVYMVIMKLVLLLVSCLTCARLLFTYYSSIAAMQEQLAEFHFENARSVCCDAGHMEDGEAVICDRVIVKRRVRQRLHKKLGSLLTCEEFGRAMERFRIMEEEQTATTVEATPQLNSGAAGSAGSPSVLASSRPAQLIALPIFVPMMTQPPRALQAPQAPQPVPTGSRIPIFLAEASLVKGPDQSDVKQEEREECKEDEEQGFDTSSKVSSLDETTTDDEADLESFSDLRIEWVRATSEGPLPVERTFIQFNTRTQVHRRRSKSL